MLYKLIWLLLQVFATIYKSIVQIIWRLRLVSRSYDQIYNNSKEICLEHDRVFLEKCKTELSKLPKHLCIIIGADTQVKEEDISRIFSYALIMDIGCVSFFDTRSSEDQRMQLQKLRPPKGLHCKQLGKRHLLWTTSVEETIGADCVLNGKILNGSSCTSSSSLLNNLVKDKSTELNYKRNMEIYEIRACDGHALISDVCRDLFERRQSEDVQQLLKNRSLLTQRIDEEISQRIKFKDPDLCIILGKQLCTFGVLPWHTRFTEFFLHEYEKYFDAETIAKILYRYSRCEQRWGK